MGSNPIARSKYFNKLTDPVTVFRSGNIGVTTSRECAGERRLKGPLGPNVTGLVDSVVERSGKSISSKLFDDCPHHRRTYSIPDHLDLVATAAMLEAVCLRKSHRAP